MRTSSDFSTGRFVMGFPLVTAPGIAPSLGVSHCFIAPKAFACWFGSFGLSLSKGLCQAHLQLIVCSVEVVVHVFKEKKKRPTPLLELAFRVWSFVDRTGLFTSTHIRMARYPRTLIQGFLHLVWCGSKPVFDSPLSASNIVVAMGGMTCTRSLVCKGTMQVCLRPWCLCPIGGTPYQGSL